MIVRAQSSHPSNRIYLLTRLVAALLGLAVSGAFYALYFHPTRTAELFAWKVQPPMTAMFMGAAYANGCVVFAAILFGRAWHRVWAPHVGVIVFSTLLLVATLMHWERFNHGHPVFWAWVALYAAAPVLVPWVLLRNRREDPGTFDLRRDTAVPLGLRALWLIPGAVILAGALWAFMKPSWLIPHWPWHTTPLTMRVIVCFYSLMGVAVFTVLTESRWSAWRVGMIGVILWHTLVLIAAVIQFEDFHAPGVFWNWWFYCELAVWLSAVLTYVVMGVRARRR